MSLSLSSQSTGYAPGKKFYYSNVGYQTLHFLLEKLEGKKYSEIMEKQFFNPLGMIATSAIIDHDIRKQSAVGYTSFYDDRPTHATDPVVESTWIEYDIGDGCISSNPKDMAAYMRMILNRGKGPKGRIISEKAFNTFAKPFPPEVKDLNYGYGIGASKINNYNCLAHGGGMIGYTCFMVCDMDNGLGVMVFLNTLKSPYTPAVFVLKTMQAAIHKKTLPKLPGKKIPTKVENASDYAGTYTSKEGKRLHFEAEGETLVLIHKKKKILLEKRGKDLFYANHNEFSLYLLSFHRIGILDPVKDKQKHIPDTRKIGEVLYGPDWYTSTEYKGADTFKYPKKWHAYTGHYRTQNPWFNNFKIILQKGKLVLFANGSNVYENEGLVEIEPGVFNVNKNVPESLRFDTVVEGKALRANYSGCYYYRVAD
jgi:D-alanyl-D-alanine carboxypeptidase